MGFFDYVSSSIDNAKQTVEDARLEAVNTGDPYYVMKMLKRGSGLKVSGYAAGLRDLLRDKDLYELKQIYRDAYNDHNSRALAALRLAFDDKGYGYELQDDNGRWIHPDRL